MKKKPKPILEPTRINMGCDPEFFFFKGGEVLEAEKVISKDGVTTPQGRVIIDGIQAELNPSHSDCRKILANNIAKCFYQLAEKIKWDKELRVDFSQMIKVGREKLDSIDKNTKRLGCNPSRNIHNKHHRANKITIDTNTYQFRSAGGHIHLGRLSNTPDTKLPGDKVINNPSKLIPMMDVIVGNTCVLLDRDIGNRERRKVYGKAGEYRVNDHGIEYRTLSNFWLRSYPLMSLVFGLSRYAVELTACGFDKIILAGVDMKNITKAINENDFELAYKNFLKIEPILLEITPTLHPFQESLFPIHKGNIEYFKHFVKMGIDYWFRENPMKHWLARVGTYSVGWEHFVDSVVKEDKEKLFNRIIDQTK